jgi:glycosyltransferase involved in cell wall biosynthesis
MRIWYVPIEPLSERYTHSWYYNIFKYFVEKGCKVSRIDGLMLNKEIEVGTFLDINSTVYYKSSQLGVIARMFRDHLVKDGDVFFFGDLEFWGLESVRLMAQMNNVDVKIYGFLHAASYTREDAFSVAKDYQKYTELGWIGVCDKIFVGSMYHKLAIIERRLMGEGHLEFNLLTKGRADRITVTGNPMFQDDYESWPELQKKNQLIICNRFDYEKRPNLSLDFARILKERNPDLNIVVTTSRKEFKSNRQWLVQLARSMDRDGIISIHAGLTKAEYHHFLAESKVMLSNTIEENFGYVVAEACHYGCYPIVQNAFSHPELVMDDSLMFDDEDEIIGKIETVLRGKSEVDESVVRSWADRHFYAMDRIWGEMQ